MSLSGEICLVTGAFGFLGKRIIMLLLEEGVAEIRLLNRFSLANLSSYDICLRPGIILVNVFEGDIRAKGDLRKACRGASTVIHTASIIDVTGSVDYNELYEVNLLLETCFQENVTSFIYTSSIEVVGPNTQGDPVFNGDEETPYFSQLKFPYSKTKWEAEQMVLKVNGQPLSNGGSLASCALRPTYIYGDGCRFLQGHMTNGVRNRNVLLRICHSRAKVNPVYVGNVAFAHVLAARALKDTQKRITVGGNFYFISDDTPHVSYSDFSYMVMSPLGFVIQERPVLPFSLLFFLSFLLEKLQTFLRPFFKFTPPLNRQLLTMLNTPFTFSYQKAHRDLGYTPRYDWEESRKYTTDWLASSFQTMREQFKAHK
uniref:Hydroxy-delta-5-steroid dehydrogenase, 3 beta- and steroid delta-isomerase 2 n=1 Tax=Paramormyrops kingsleyae TaxID=1676925 RepID=A0A3B3RBD8_9TELE